MKKLLKNSRKTPAFSLVEMKERGSGKKSPSAQLRKKSKKTLAFSLVEMMVVVALIGILVSLALPRFRTFIAKARMGEAVHNLGVINKLQLTYHTHFQMLNRDGVWFTGGLIGAGSCSGSAKKNKLGFRVEDCGKLRYYYEAGGLSQDTALNEGGTPHRIYPGCSGGSKDDEWKIYRRQTGPAGNKLDHTKDIIEECE